MGRFIIPYGRIVPTAIHHRLRFFRCDIRCVSSSASLSSSESLSFSDNKFLWCSAANSRKTMCHWSLGRRIIQANCRCCVSTHKSMLTPFLVSENVGLKSGTTINGRIMLDTLTRRTTGCCVVVFTFRPFFLKLT